MPDLSGLRAALDAWHQAETDDDKARAAARVFTLAPPRLIANLIVRLDEFEAREQALARRITPTGEVGLAEDNPPGKAPQSQGNA